MSKIKLVLFVLPLLIIALPIRIFAASGTTNSLLCGNSNQNLSTLEDITHKYVPDGKAYLKLNYQTNPIDLSLYINNYTNSQCDFIGSITANANSWVYVGNITRSSNDVIVQGLNVEAAPYQAAVQLLIAPNNQCIPTTLCNVAFGGLNGVLQLDDSNILSGATDQIAVYGLKPIDNVGIKSVAYYSNAQGNLLYTSTKLGTINKNYLGGGLHNIQLQIKLKNGQTIYANQTVDMGIDWTGTLYIKSLIYRNSGSAAIFIILGISLLLFLVLLALARYIYRRHRAAKLHGLNKYHEPSKKNYIEDNIIIK
jgi:hypothetical protein